YVIFGRSDGFPAAINLATLSSGEGFRLDGVDAGDHLGYSVSCAGDVNGDGYDDLIAGAPAASPNGIPFAGASYVLFGHRSGPTNVINLSELNGTNGFRLDGNDTGDSSGWRVSGAGDINGDGYDDLFVSAINPGNGAGASYIVFGRDFDGAVTHEGTLLADVLIGDASPNVMIGGAGDDILISLGGEDVLRGGEGNDVMAISDLTFFRLDGGNGIDTLRLDTRDITLDLVGDARGRIDEFEAIDLRGSGKNYLRLDQLSVLNLSNSSNTLIIMGDGDDTVLGTDFHGWLRGGTVQVNQLEYESYTFGAANLLINGANFTQTNRYIVSVGAGYTEDFRSSVTLAVNGQNGRAVQHSIDVAFGDAIITGTVSEDINVDGQRSTDEPGVEGMVLYFDRDGDQSYDLGEPTGFSDYRGRFIVLGLDERTAIDQLKTLDQRYVLQFDLSRNEIAAQRVANAGQDQRTDEGSEIALSGVVRDPNPLDGNSFTAEWLVTNELGVTEFALGPQVLNLTEINGVWTQSLNASFTPTDNGVLTATLFVSDNDGGRQYRDELRIEVSNVAPVITLSGTAIAAVEGAAITIDGNPLLSDVPGDAITFDWKAADPSGNPLPVVSGPAPASPSSGDYDKLYVDDQSMPQLLAANEGSYSISLRVADDDMPRDVNGVPTLWTNWKTFTIDVANVNPQVQALTLTPTGAQIEGTEFSLSGSVLEPGILDLVELQVDWGDDSEPRLLTLGAENLPIRNFSGLLHRYNNQRSGGYTITVSVRDGVDAAGNPDPAWDYSQTIAADVINALPVLSGLLITPSINEGQAVTLTGVATDAGV
ncbi:MAG: FG-GAP repeat protein, partial [Planctomycetales bacterium]|nr:FG-GAP repeat protein [Planctomycetales bacterium]